jgi:hypothetical protein
LQCGLLIEPLCRCTGREDFKKAAKLKYEILLLKAVDAPPPEPKGGPLTLKEKAKLAKAQADKDAAAAKPVFVGSVKDEDAADFFDKAAACAVVAVATEKLGDKKLASVVRDMLYELAASINPGFVIK